MIPDIDNLIEEIKRTPVTDKESLENFRLKFLSRKGEIQSLFGQMGNIPKEDRARFGKAMNEVKQLAETKFEQGRASLEDQQKRAERASEDISLPVSPSYAGSLHPLTQTVNEMKDIFLRLGFDVSDGPEIEDDFHNFSALNFPPDHPARDMQDTFFIRRSEKEQAGDLVMRTHTSPVQIRLMQETEPPIRSVMPGRVFRNEAVTAKSYFQFNQMEGLYVGKNVTMGELIETLVMFARMMYGVDVQYRVRPSYFPFTEPSIEMDVWWETENGGQWLEILGAGMVDPNVFKSVGLNPETTTGFAFGMGVDRIAMLRYGIDDIRMLYENDIRFLSQFTG
ncbi:MAG: phenylalanine--tRNA ligase subunit alpha [Balneolaceae bacterium]